MRVTVLGSGSQGNAVVVEGAGGRLLLDAGFSGRELERRLEIAGLSSDGIDGAVITHEHSDHSRGARWLARRAGVPLWGTEGTRDSLRLAAATRDEWRVLRSGEPVEIFGFTVEPFLLPHDSSEPIGVVVEDAAGGRVGLLADLGCRSHLAWARLRDIDVLLLETNHDLDMLRRGPYPWPLKQRIASRHGHLSNHEAAEGLPELLCDRLQWIVLYHLSRTNNHPELARECVGRVVDRRGSPARLMVSDQFTPTPWIEVTA